jgi:phosphomevalonate kinase
MIVATAPGKLFLTGEWAVLRGAPALVVAVDRVVRVEVDAEEGDGALTIESLAEGRTWQGNAHDAGTPQGDAGAVVAVLRGLGWIHGRVVVDSRPFLIGERKLGLGRSAATIAAAVVARRRLAGATLEPRADLADALAANARFQDGQGSGADIAAAVYGGVVAAERRKDRRHDELTVTRHTLPDGLELVAGWTGESAATTPLVSAFAAMPSPPVLPALTGAARDAVAAIGANDGARLCDAVDRSGDLLVRFGAETGLPIVTPALRRLIDGARAAGAVAKPSGAGGGDCGIAIAPTARVAAAVRAAWRDAGILPLDVVVAAQGAVDHGAVR